MIFGVVAVLAGALAFCLMKLGGLAQAKKNAIANEQAAKEQLKKEAERKKVVAGLKKEIFSGAEKEKQRLGNGDIAARFAAVNELMRKQ